MVQTGEALSRLAQWSTALAGADTPEMTLEVAITATRDMLACSGAGIWLVRGASTFLDLGFVDAPEAQSMHGLLRVTFTQGLIGQVADQQTAQIVNVGEWGAQDAVWLALGVQTSVVIPVLWGGEVLGVLAGWSNDATCQFGQHDVALLEIIGQAFAGRYTALLNEATRGGEQKRLQDVHAAIRMMLEAHETTAGLQHVVSALRDLGWRQVVLGLCGSDNTIEELFAAGEPWPGETHGCDAVLPPDIREQLMRHELDEYRRDGVYFVAAGAVSDPEWNPDDLVFAPLGMEQDQIAGVVRLNKPLDGRRPSPEMLRLVDILVSQAAYIIENARLLDDSSRSAAALAEQVDELSMMHRADRELSSHLDMNRVMRLAMDWAVRRTAANAVVLALVTEDAQGVVPFVTLGLVGDVIPHYTEVHPWRLGDDLLGQAVQTRQARIARMNDNAIDVSLYPDYAQTVLAVPLAMRGEVLGVIVLISANANAFDANDISFMERLGRRTAVALDNARLYRRVKQMAEDMMALYGASRAISSSLERDEVLEQIARSMAETLECSAAIIFDFRAEQYDLQVLVTHRVPERGLDGDWSPKTPTTVPVRGSEVWEQVIEQRTMQVVQSTGSTLASDMQEQMQRYQAKTLLILPLVAQEQLIGVATVIESREERYFRESELAKAEALASQAAVALRQAMLYSEVLELERIKTEMIRMASHDIRNPLNNVMGYLQLMDRSLQKTGMTPEQEQYLNYLRNSTGVIKSLIEDLLTLERIESERGGGWRVFDFSGLVIEVMDVSVPGAQLKRQTLTMSETCGEVPVLGSETQLRQAITNFISNAIKYTPETGQIQVTCHLDGTRMHFMVKDNGYGIARDRQQRIFERFYRARMPGTEHISGSGLGLSLVKTVIERHGGKVWFESEAGVGSTFGFWLPVAVDQTTEELR